MSKNIKKSLPLGGILAGLGAAFVLAAPSAAFSQMYCPVDFDVTSSGTLGTLQITANYAAASALGDIVSCTIVPAGTTDQNLSSAGNFATLGYVDLTGFSSPGAFASCVFRTTGDTAPVAGNFSINIDDSTDAAVPPNTVAATVTATVGACVPAGSCSSTPETGCKVSTTAGKSKISFKDNADNTKDQGQFGWKAGAATDVSEFSDPTTAGETWSWCTYNQGVLVGGYDVPSGTGWAASGTTGFSFKGDVNGVAGIKVKAGEAGKASVSVKAKSKAGNFSSPVLPLTTGPVVSQLVIDNGMTTSCYQITGGTPKKNDAASYSAAGNP